ncbi:MULTISPECIES: protealysin inhibitor emfourin [unclassified Curtobacterium]|uniref:protealysin inhibitor emfourin n=1 Tax=unclassified Curtobacterium TaxID=257496 RepID=UPI00034B12BC|nr:MULTISPECIES: protealysin inhibitor emfourin [unclassified Curtobacterium]
MHIEVRRSGGFAGTTRGWQVDTDTCDDPAAWTDLVGTLPGDVPAPSPVVRDDFTWTITLEQRTVSIPGSRLDGPWAALVTRVRDEGDTV